MSKIILAIIVYTCCLNKTTTKINEPTNEQPSSHFLDATTHLYKRSCPSVGPSVRRSVPCYFRKTKIVDFEDRKSSNDIINNATMSDDEVVASYGPPLSLLDATTHLYKRSSPSVRPLVRLTRLIFEGRKSLFLRLERLQMTNDNNNDINNND